MQMAASDIPAIPVIYPVAEFTAYEKNNNW